MCIHVKRQRNSQKTIPAKQRSSIYKKINIYNKACTKNRTVVRCTYLNAEPSWQLKDNIAFFCIFGAMDTSSSTPNETKDTHLQNEDHSTDKNHEDHTKRRKKNNHAVDDENDRNLVGITAAGISRQQLLDEYFASLPSSSTTAPQSTTETADDLIVIATPSTLNSNQVTMVVQNEQNNVIVNQNNPPTNSALLPFLAMGMASPLYQYIITFINIDIFVDPFNIFIKLCSDRSVEWHRDQNNQAGLSILSLRMRKWLDQHFYLIDWGTPLMNFILRYTIVSQDMTWLRLLIEYGADITELDQGCLYDMACIDYDSFSASDITPTIKYVIQLLMVNCNCLNYQNLPINTFRQFKINDLTLLRLLLNCNGQLPDFTMYTLIPRGSYNLNHLCIALNNQNNIKFFQIILENDLITIPNEIIFALLQRNACHLRPINKIERAFLNCDTTNVKWGYSSCVSFFYGMVEAIKKAILSMHIGDELLCLLIDNYLYRCKPYGDISWLLENYYKKSYVESTLELCAKCGYINSFKKLLHCIRTTIDVSIRDTNDVMDMKITNIIHNIFLSTENLNILRHFIENEGINPSITNDETDILDSVCGKLIRHDPMIPNPWLKVIVSKYKASDVSEAIKCIEYLAINTNFSLRQSIERSNSSLINRLLGIKCYTIVDELLKWCYGYHSVSVPPEGGNIYECRIPFGDSKMNPLGYAIAVCRDNDMALDWIDYLLIHHGMDANSAVDTDGNTLFIHMMNLQRYQISRELINRYNVDVSIRNKHGESVEGLVPYLL